MFHLENTSPRAQALALCALSTSLFGVLPARAHEAPTGWNYPLSCCANHDCQSLSVQAISERPEGYVVNGTGEIVAYADKRVKDSPDGLYHWCAHQAGLDAGRTICLFVPPKGY